MSEVFGPGYARTYDSYYAEKDYDGEVRMLGAIFDRFGDGRIRRVLDLGCGTGSHVLRLAKSGFEVTGVDRSEAMIAIAREKVRGAGVSADFVVGDMTELALPRRFDAVVLMFAVLGYQIDNETLRRTFVAVRKHLRSGGLVVFDAWYGPAVLMQGPSERFRVLETGPRQLIRATTPKLRPDRHVVELEIRQWAIVGNRVESATSETHVVRFFFPLELEALLADANLQSLHGYAFPDLNAPPGAGGNWNLGWVAKAV